jgi:predicted transposase YdaD
MNRKIWLQLFKFEEEIEIITRKNYTMGIKEQLLEMAMERGLEQGREEGRISFVKNLLLKTDHDIQTISELADVSIDFVVEVKNMLSEQ